MNNKQFLNKGQPQTLVNATILCYMEAFFGLLSSGSYLPLVAVAVGLGAGGFGIANEQKWGYGVATIASILNVGLWLEFFGFDVLGFPQIISFGFAVVLVVLLLHPISRSYQRIWFR